MKLLLLALAACGHPPAHSQPADTNHIVVDGDLVIRPEGDGAIGVIATATFADVSGSGHARLLHSTIERAPSSPYISLARMRAWQVILRQLDGNPQAYEAGLKAEDLFLGCGKVDHDRIRFRAEQRRAKPDGLVDAAKMLSKLLDDQLAGCVERYRGEAE